MRRYFAPENYRVRAN